MDKNEFFKEATKRICSQLSIEQAMLSSLNFLGDFMPADRMMYTLFDQGLSAARVVAAVTKNGEIHMDFLIPLSKDAQNKNIELVETFKKEVAPHRIVLVKKNIFENQLFKEVLMPIDEEVSSLIIYAGGIIT